MRMKHQLGRLAEETDRGRQNFWVRKVLRLIDNSALRLAAVTAKDRGLTVECNFIDAVWDDPRIQNRLRELERQGIRVERREARREIAGHSFSRHQLFLQF